MTRRPLGRGHVTAVLHAHGRLWFVLARRASRGHEVVPVDPGTGAVSTALGRDALDIPRRPAAPPHPAAVTEAVDGVLHS